MKKSYWLGFIFIVAITILLYGTLTVGSINIFAKVSFYDISFERVEGLKKGDDVRVDGVVMGKVEEIRLDPADGVRVKVRMEQPLSLYEHKTQRDQSYSIRIEAFSVLGGSYVSIRRGKGEPVDLAVTKPLTGRVTPGPFEALSKAVEENREDLSRIMQNVRDTFAETKKLVGDINEGKGTIGALMKDDKLYTEAKDTLAELKKAAADVKDSTANVKEITRKINEGDGTVAKLLNSDELHKEVVKSVTDVREEVKKAVDEIKKVAETTKETVQKVNSGEGVVARALNDKKVADDFAATMERLRVITGNIEKISDNLATGKGTIGKALQDDTLYEQGKEALKNLNKSFGRAANALVYVGGENRWYTDSDASIAKVYFRIEPDDTKYFQVGASIMSLYADSEPITFDTQIEEGDDDTFIKVDLVAAYRIPWFLENRLGLRIGALEGKPGGGIDLDLDVAGHEFLISFDIRDAYNSVKHEDIDENIGGPMTRLWMKTPLWNYAIDEKTKKRTPPKEWWQQILYAVKLYAGVSRIQDEPEFAFGIALEYSDEDLRTLMGLISTAR
jgi:phospholipid/cholesterol/gamma-HCH transport system substrate-binding protein